MTRLRAKRAWVIWLVTVLSVFMASTALLAIVGSASFGGHHPVSGFIPQAAANAAWLCIVACGPPTAVALWLRQRRSGTVSVLGGLAAAVLTFALLYLPSGSDSVTAAPSMVIILALEFALALTLRSVSVRRSVVVRS
jgi:hypothetical protein